MAIEDEVFEMKSFDRRYLKWLVSLVDGNDHLLLFKQLHEIIFRWDPDVPMDENREYDGRRLRDMFEEETGYHIPTALQDWPSSFLEVLVALAVKMEKGIMHAPGNGDGTAAWFWMIAGNAGFTRCTDTWYEDNGQSAYFYVAERSDEILLRRYSSNGSGGLFPLENPKEDQRKVELWYQMNAYILERNWV